MATRTVRARAPTCAAVVALACACAHRRFRVGPAVLVDSDGSAYLIYTTLSHGHGMSIERLAPDYLSSLGATDPSQSSGIFGDGNVEAPAVFKRGEIYYAVFGECCCYCGSGSSVARARARSLARSTAQCAVGAEAFLTLAPLPPLPSPRAAS